MQDINKEIPLPGKNNSPSPPSEWEGRQTPFRTKTLPRNLSLIFAIPPIFALLKRPSTCRTKQATFMLKHRGVASAMGSGERDSCKQGLCERFQISCFSLLILFQLKKIIYYSIIKIRFCCVNYTQTWILGYRRGFLCSPA